MGLLEQFMGAVNNPNQLANVDQLASIFGILQQLSANHNIDSGTVQTILSIVSGYVRSSLQNTQNESGSEQVQSLVNQYSSLAPSQEAVTALLSSSQAVEIEQVIGEKTGLDPAIIQQILPVLVPIVLNLLQSGASNDNPQGANPLLNSFLDADGDGNLNIGDAMNLASRFLGR